MSKKVPVYTAKYEYAPMGNWYRWNGYEEYLTGVEAFLYRGTIWMHRKEENPEEIAKKEIWDLLGFPRATGHFIGEEEEKSDAHTPISIAPFSAIAENSIC